MRNVHCFVKFRRSSSENSTDFWQLLPRFCLPSVLMGCTFFVFNVQAAMIASMHASSPHG